MDDIERLADLVLAKILEKYGDISPLTLLANEEELLVSELARLNTILVMLESKEEYRKACLLYTSPSPRDVSSSRMPSSA